MNVTKLKIYKTTQIKIITSIFLPKNHNNIKINTLMFKKT